jgi:hypothetical protein
VQAPTLPRRRTRLQASAFTLSCIGGITGCSDNNRTQVLDVNHRRLGVVTLRRERRPQ